MQYVFALTTMYLSVIFTAKCYSILKHCQNILIELQVRTSFRASCSSFLYFNCNNKIFININKEIRHLKI